MLKVGLKMKKRVSENMVVQVIRECLLSVPFLQLGKISIDESALKPDFKMEVRVKNKSLKILAEYKDNGQPRVARLAAYQIKDWLAQGVAEYGVFIAPYISPATAVICKEAGVGYLDLAGNCLLSFDTVFIHREGNVNPYIQPRKHLSLYSTKAERILRVLLADPKKNWKTEALAKAANVSYGQISNVKKLLSDQEWLETGENGVRLKNPGIVLDGWAAQYRSQRNQTVDYYAMTDIAECEYQFAEICSQRNMRYALTAFSGAARLAPSVRYQRMYAYVEGNPDSLADALGWKRVTSGANVGLLLPYDEGVFIGSQEIDGIQIAAPVQIYLDLQSQHGRGQEAAQNIRKVIEKSW